MDFGTFDLRTLRDNPHGVLDLGDGVIRELAGCIKDYTLPTGDEPLDLSDFVGRVGKHKELQLNVEQAKAALGGVANPTAVAAELMQHSGCMDELHRAFEHPYVEFPDYFDHVVWAGGTANWQLRRRDEFIDSFSPTQVGTVWLPHGKRVMSVTEHQLVRTYNRKFEGLPTEYDFARTYVEPTLVDADFTAETYKMKSTKGAEVYQQFFEENPDVAFGTILIIGNAPNTVQATAEAFLAAIKVNSQFNVNGDQLFMHGDSFPLALNGEPPRKAQSPLTGLGQLARNAKLLVEAAQVTRK